MKRISFIPKLIVKNENIDLSSDGITKDAISTKFLIILYTLRKMETKKNGYRNSGESFLKI